MKTLPTFFRTHLYRLPVLFFLITVCGCTSRFSQQLLSSRTQALRNVAVPEGQEGVYEDCIECTSAWSESGLFDEAWQTVDSLFPDGQPIIVLERGSGWQPYSPRYIVNALFKMADHYELIQLTDDMGPDLVFKTMPLDAKAGEVLASSIEKRITNESTRFHFGPDMVDHCDCALLHVLPSRIQTVWFCSSIRDTALINFVDRALNPDSTRHK